MQLWLVDGNLDRLRTQESRSELISNDSVQLTARLGIHSAFLTGLRGRSAVAVAGEDSSHFIAVAELQSKVLTGILWPSREGALAAPGDG
jgi:hypothetical protein